MKKVIYTILLFVSAGFVLTACSNGDYNANPSSNANSSVNPLAPLNSAQLAAFVTTGTPSFITATINGSPWSSGDSSTGWYLVDTTGYNVITGFSGGKVVALFLANVYAVNIYKMGHLNKETYGLYGNVDSSFHTTDAHYSYLGNSGEVQILENDPSAIRGTFYFQGIDSSGDVINVSNGYFNISKL